jgi:hypothetical protein
MTINSVVYKYPIRLTDDLQPIRIQNDWKILTFDSQGMDMEIWVLADSSKPPLMDDRPRVFKLVGTGQHFDGTGFDYVGTCQLRNGTLVYHLFEQKSEV